MQDVIAIVLMIGLILLIGGIYFMPTIVALNRKHHNRYAILVLNLFFGLTFVGWVISLSWSLTKVESK